MNAAPVTLFAPPAITKQVIMRRYSEGLANKARAVQELKREPMTKLSEHDKLLISKQEITGMLHELKEHCAGLEDRLHKHAERPVGFVCDTTNACTGKLYDLRDELMAREVGKGL